MGLINGEEPVSVARDLTAFSYLEACNPAQTHHRTQARRPFINEWLQLVYFSSFKTGPRRPELKAIRMLRLYPEELEEGASDEDVSSLSASQKPG